MSICLFLGLITCAFTAQAQSTKEFKKDAVRNFVFKAYSGQVGNKTKFKLNQKENIVELRGDSAFVNVSKFFNKDMGKHGVGGVLHKGTISRLELFKKTDLIEVSFILTSQRAQITVELDFWDNGNAYMRLVPMNTSINLDLSGYLH